MYENILVAIDLSNDTQAIVNQAIRMAANDKSKLSLVHVVEPVAAAYSMDIYAFNVNELQQEAIKFAEQRVAELSEKLGISSDKAHTILGSPGAEIRNLAKEINADAIVIGSHGHRGWKILLGSTAIKVLHGATCDVLTVHVSEA
ncbi:MAG: universal stress protein A [Pseudohongiellaceae bacterium]|jgi:universal stress protein A